MCVRTVAVATLVAFCVMLVPRDLLAAPKKGRGQVTRGARVSKPSAPAAAPLADTTPPAASTTAPPALSTKYRAVALMPFTTRDLSDESLRAIETSLLNEIDEKGGMRAVTPRDVITEAATYQLDPAKCGLEDAACIAQVARFARAHLAVVTRISAFGGVVNMSLRLIDTQTAKEIGRVAEALVDKNEERALQLHRMTVQLFAPSEYVGTLIVKSDETGADVYLNDKLVGTTPLKQPLKSLPAGAYILHVSKEGFADLYQFVDVVYNKTTTITASLATNTVTGALAVDSESGFGQVFVVATEPNVEIRIDGEPQGLTPLEGAIAQVKAGTRRLSLRLGSGPPLVRELPVEPGQRTDVGVIVDEQGNMTAVIVVSKADDPLPIDPSMVGQTKAAESVTITQTPVVEPVRHTWAYPAGLATAGVGVAALVVGGVFGAKTHSANSDADQYESILNSTTSTSEERADARTQLAQLNDSGPSSESKQYLFYGIGAGLVVAGGLLVAADHWHWFGLGKPKPKTPETSVNIGLVPNLAGGGMMTLGATF